MNASWKTTLFGAGGLLAILTHAAAQYASGGWAAVDWNTLMAGALPAFGLLFARDNNKTSAQVGAGK